LSQRCFTRIPRLCQVCRSRPRRILRFSIVYQSILVF
jgi:hypothetical protein